MRKLYLTKTAIRQASLFLVLALITLITLIPIIWAAMLSFKLPADAFTIPPKIFFEPTLRFHQQIWGESQFPRYLLNSVIVCLGTVLISVPIGSLAAFSLSRMPKQLAQPILLGIFSLRMLPFMLLAIPFFVFGRWTGLIDTHWILILSLVAINQPFTIWLMYGFFEEIPRELDEAAALDGCNAWQTFFHVVLPLVKPGIAVTSIFSIILAYNEFLLALILTGERTRTLPVAIASFGGEDITEWSRAAASAVGVMVPIIIVLILMQRQLVRGMTMGAVK
ncbi:carbohydrate ABC transporter permease [Corticibacterium sp. UT-5YL-CI-8]|nr:carbohydrate ABC transporter permease [Tianweitania sp. UT-5YL-CI-8]